MPSPSHWPPETMKKLFALAETIGSSKAVMETEDDARRFRFALYTFRRTSGIGENVEITITGNDVILRLRHSPTIVISTDTDCVPNDNI